MINDHKNKVAAEGIRIGICFKLDTVNGNLDEVTLSGRTNIMLLNKDYRITKASQYRLQ